VSVAPAVAVTSPATVSVAAAPTAAPAAASGPHAKPGDRTHTVLPGESLWTIAANLLGSDASTAKVAREVHRLWQLNRDRIATGDPDLLMVGTRLDLR
jgi:Tfp pilus assembly protein FimV